MGYVKKSEREKEFVDYILSSGGIDCYGKQYERGHWYWFFNLKNGERRYWTDMSEKSQKILGISE